MDTLLSLSPYLIVLVLMIVALIATIRIGTSKVNKEGNPEYDKKTSSYWRRLSFYYVLSLIIIIVGFVYFVFYG